MGKMGDGRCDNLRLDSPIMPSKEHVRERKRGTLTLPRMQMGGMRSDL